MIKYLFGRGMALALGSLTLFVLGAGAVSAQSRDANSGVTVTVSGTPLPGATVRGGEPRDEGRKTEQGTIVHEDVSPLTISHERLEEFLKRVLENPETKLVVTVTEITSDRKVMSTYVGDGTLKVDPTATGTGNSYEEVTIKPIRLELNP